ncbi:MAG: UbiA family prenyltransferase [Anaerolineaceae bacterium]
MTKRVQAFLQLVRPKDYFFFVLATSLLGIAAAQGEFGLRFVLVCAANFCASSFTFIFNQLADAPADTFRQKKSAPNPIAQGSISASEAALTALAAAVLSLALFWLLDWRLLFVGLVLLGFGLLYSERGTRVHGISMLDLAGHSWLLAPALSLSGYLAFQPRFTTELLFLFLTVIFLSLLGEITHERSSLKALKEAPARQTVLNISARAVHFLVIACASAALLSGIILFFFLRVLPLRAAIFVLVCGGILLIPGLFRSNREPTRLPLHIPLEKAVALGLLVEFLTSFLIRWL